MATLSEFLKIYQEAFEKRKEVCREEMESLNSRAQIDIQEYLKPSFTIIIRTNSGQQIYKNYTSFESALLDQCAQGYNYIEYIFPKFNDTVKNTNGNTLNLVTGVYRIRGHNCEGFKGPNILDKIRKQFAPEIIIKMEASQSRTYTLRIEVPVP
jgi:hypothetical protein